VTLHEHFPTGHALQSQSESTNFGLPVLIITIARARPGSYIHTYTWYTHRKLSVGHFYQLLTLFHHIPKSSQTSTAPEEFVLHPQPLSYNYNEFERLLLGIAHHIYVTKKKGEAFEEVSYRLRQTIQKGSAGVWLQVVRTQDVCMELRCGIRY